MASFRSFEVTPGAIESARRAGVCGDIVKRVRRMARRSAPLTMRDWNRRFQDFALYVEDGRVVDLARLDFN